MTLSPEIGIVLALQDINDSLRELNETLRTWLEHTPEHTSLEKQLYGALKITASAWMAPEKCQDSECPMCIPIKRAIKAYEEA